MIFVNRKPVSFDEEMYDAGHPIEVKFGRVWVRPVRSNYSRRENWLSFWVDGHDDEYCFQYSCFRMAVLKPNDILEMCSLAVDKRTRL